MREKRMCGSFNNYVYSFLVSYIVKGEMDRSAIRRLCLFTGVILFISAVSLMCYWFCNSDIVAMAIPISSLAALFSSVAVFVLSRKLEFVISDLEVLRNAEFCAAREKEVFLNSVNHEILTPINGISGVFQLMGQTNLTKEQLDLVESGVNSINRLMNYAMDLLDLSRLAQSGIHIKNAPLSIQHLMSSLLEVQFENTQLDFRSLEIVIDSDVPTWIIGDKNHLARVIRILVDCASKLSKKIVITVQVTVKGSMIFFVIREDGVGLAEETQARISDNFGQAGSDIHSQFGEFGLGISICKEIVELMQGEIGVASELCKGSNFWFTIPLVAVEQPEQSSQLQSEKLIDSFEGIDVLVVEDNLTNQMVLRRFLEGMGCQVDIVDDGIPAIQCCNVKSYEMIFMDIRLPQIDGLEATKYIRSQAGINQFTPIVGVSANATREQTYSYLQAGMNAFLSKPLRKSDLTKIMRSLLEVVYIDNQLDVPPG